MRLSLIHIWFKSFRVNNLNTEMVLVNVKAASLGTFTRNTRTYKPVSYTHLDVYKRQVFSGSIYNRELKLIVIRAEFNKQIKNLVYNFGRTSPRPCLLYTSYPQSLLF